VQCEVPIREERDVVLARLAVREAASTLGFNPSDTTRIVTAVSELARNLFEYAGRGVMRVISLQEDGRQGIEVVFEDQGPGIIDLDQAMLEGFSTGGGCGLGLPGARRLMDEMEVQSTRANGTTISMKKWRSD